MTYPFDPYGRSRPRTRQSPAPGTVSLADFQKLQEIAEEISLPAFAIGGITLKNLPQVLDTGFCRIAVSGCVNSAADPRDAIAQLMAAKF